MLQLSNLSGAPDAVVSSAQAEVVRVYAAAGVKLTYLPFFVKAAVAALKEVPIVNSTLDESANEIVLHNHYGIGIAVATAGGLIVPVVRDADKKDIGTIAREIDRISADARAGRPRLQWRHEPTAARRGRRAEGGGRSVRRSRRCRAAAG